jgi:hypothetical protein
MGFPSRPIALTNQAETVSRFNVTRHAHAALWPPTVVVSPERPLGVHAQGAFLRFPGGCIVEGANLANAYDWKRTDRAGRRVRRPPGGRPWPPTTVDVIMTDTNRTTSRRWAIAVAACLLGASVHVPATPAVAASVAVDVVTSLADGSVRVQASNVAADIVDTAPGIDVHLDRPRQATHGVGAALTESSAYLIA